MTSGKGSLYLAQAKAAWPGEWEWSDDECALKLEVTPLLKLRVSCCGFLQIRVNAYLIPNSWHVCLHIESKKSLEVLLENCRTLLQGFAVDLRAVPKTTCLPRAKRGRRRTLRVIKQQ